MIVKKDNKKGPENNHFGQTFCTFGYVGFLCESDERYSEDECERVRVYECTRCIVCMRSRMLETV